MGMEERIYRYSRARMILAIFMVGVLAYLIADLDFMPGIFMALLFIYVASYGLHVLRSKVILTESGIRVQKALGAKELRWSEIKRVSGAGNGLKLYNHDGDVALAPDPQVQGFSELIDFIGDKRGDLFESEEFEWFTRAPYAMVLGGLAAVGLMALGVFATLLVEEEGVWVQILGLVWMALGLAVAAVILLGPYAITLEKEGLLLESLFRKRFIAVEDIQNVGLKGRSTRDGTMYYVQLWLSNGKKINLAGMRGGTPITYLVLKRWLIPHRPPAAGPSLLAAYSTGSESKGEPGCLA